MRMNRLRWAAVLVVVGLLGCGGPVQEPTGDGGQQDPGTDAGLVDAGVGWDGGAEVAPRTFWFTCSEVDAAPGGVQYFATFFHDGGGDGNVAVNIFSAGVQVAQLGPFGVDPNTARFIMGTFATDAGAGTFSAAFVYQDLGSSDWRDAGGPEMFGVDAICR